MQTNVNNQHKLKDAHPIYKLNTMRSILKL